jgi:orotidine-5'-phosphate decarboxylase
VCSPQEVAQLRQGCGDNFLLICPGVRPEWADKGDQKRTFTPVKAIQAGANYLVIGRPITSAENPAIAWKKICEEVKSLT